MFKVLVVGYKVVSHEYFMDKMQEYEIHDFYNALHYADINDWQQTRWLLYVIAQVNSKKKLKMEEILSLPCDKGWKEKHTGNKEISNEEISQLKQMAKDVSKFIK